MSAIAKCPNCNEPTNISSENQYRPFCSERCKMIDLGGWLEEKYTIADSVNEETKQWPDEPAKH